MKARQAQGSFLAEPSACEGPVTSFDDLSLSACRDVMTRMEPDPTTERSLVSIVEGWLDDPGATTPLEDLQRVLESVRRMPAGDERIRHMNTVVRTLGRPETLAVVLDMLRDAAERDGTGEQELALMSQGGEMHCLYGWCGQTVLVHSLSHPTEGTLAPPDGAREKLGYPPATWALSIHIWQPNPNAKPFPSGMREEPGRIVEPPHTHPFDFASMLAIGSMHQSTYRQCDQGSAAPGSRYDGVHLDHVDGVWPPHDHRVPTGLATLEERVRLSAGDSYYMTCDRIHDVEVEWDVAVSRPAITLFMASEARAIPHCYMAKSMADYQAANPDLRDAATALPVARWRAKLLATAEYLRGESAGLNLDDIVSYDGEYAFFHS